MSARWTSCPRCGGSGFDEYGGTCLDCSGRQETPAERRRMRVLEQRARGIERAVVVGGAPAPEAPSSGAPRHRSPMRS